MSFWSKGKQSTMNKRSFFLIILILRVKGVRGVNEKDVKLFMVLDKASNPFAAKLLHDNARRSKEKVEICVRMAPRSRAWDKRVRSTDVRLGKRWRSRGR
ncbi:hypothetical protein RYX36_012009 [Vicia faba]